MKDTEIKALKERVSRLELEVFKEKKPDYPDYMTVSEFARSQGVSLSHSEIITISKQAVDECEQREIAVDCTLYPGYPVNIYPIEILEEILWSKE